MKQILPHFFEAAVSITTSHYNYCYYYVVTLLWQRIFRRRLPVLRNSFYKPKQVKLWRRASFWRALSSDGVAIVILPWRKQKILNRYCFQKNYCSRALPADSIQGLFLPILLYSLEQARLTTNVWKGSDLLNPPFCPRSSHPLSIHPSIHTYLDKV